MDKFDKVEQHRKETKKKVTCAALCCLMPLWCPSCWSCTICSLQPQARSNPTPHPLPTLSALCFLQMELERKFKAKDGYRYLPDAQISTDPASPSPVLQLSAQLHLHAFLVCPLDFNLATTLLVQHVSHICRETESAKPEVDEYALLCCALCLCSPR